MRLFHVDIDEDTISPGGTTHDKVLPQRLFYSGDSSRAKISILGELIIMTGLAIGFLGWTEWIDPQTAVEEVSAATVKNSSDFIILGFITILVGLGVYLADGLFRSIRHSKRHAETSRIEAPPARNAGHLPSGGSTQIRRRSSWRTGVVGTT